MTDPYVISRHGPDDRSTTVVRLSGDFDITARDDLATVLLSAVAQSRSVVVDLTEVSFLDSEAMAALIEGFNAAREARVGYAAINAQGIVHRVLEVAGLFEMRTGDAASS